MANIVKIKFLCTQVYDSILQQSMKTFELKLVRRKMIGRLIEFFVQK